MKKKVVAGLTLMLLFTGMLTLALNFKPVEATCVGDVNDDGTVNVLDVILIYANAGPVPPKPPECDVNGDGWVNVLDVILVYINAGSCS